MLQALRRPWELLLILFLALAAFHFGHDQLSLLRFDRERIEVWADDGQTQVSGLYHYSNQSILPVSFSMGLPFPVDSSHDFPTSFSVAEVTSQGSHVSAVRTREYRGDTVFRLWFWPLQEKWIRVEYIQTTHAQEARYILVTTRKWGRSLDYGEYVLHLGDGLELTSSTYSVQQDVSPLGRLYSFKRSNFFPESNWDFTWRKTRSSSVIGGT